MVSHLETVILNVGPHLQLTVCNIPRSHVIIGLPTGDNHSNEVPNMFQLRSTNVLGFIFLDPDC